MPPRELVKKRHYRQRSKNACVPTAIRMVMSSHADELGDRHTEDELLTLLGTSEIGTVLDNLNRLEEIGFSAVSVPSNLAEIQLYLAEIKKPIIALVYTAYLPYLTVESLHAVVIVGVDEQNVMINDPLLDDAPVAIPIEDFQKSWYFWGDLTIILEPITDEP